MVARKGKKDKRKPKASMDNYDVNQVPILSDEQYKVILKHFKHDARINT